MRTSKQKKRKKNVTSGSMSPATLQISYMKYLRNQKIYVNRLVKLLESLGIFTWTVGQTQQ
jgi:hypothetical protein